MTVITPIPEYPDAFAIPNPLIGNVLAFAAE
jgi:hypothetical protein